MFYLWFDELLCEIDGWPDTSCHDQNISCDLTTFQDDFSWVSIFASDFLNFGLGDDGNSILFGEV